MQNTSDSPAVQSMRKEQAKQAAAGKSRLDKGLEDTFPASDPVSITHTATAAGRADTEEAERQAEPLGLQPHGDDVHSQEIRALRREVERLRSAVSNIASGAGTIVQAEADIIAQDVRRAIARRPFETVGLVAALAFALGVLHRSSANRRFFE